MTSLDDKPEIKLDAKPAIQVVKKEEPKPVEKVSLEASPATPVEENTTPTKDSTRCHTCNKRVGLTMIKCRCGHGFCGKHRYPDTHNCEYDFKSLDRTKLAILNPKVTSNKGYDAI